MNRCSLLLLVLLCPRAFAADHIALELGVGSHWSEDAQALFLRYRGEHTIPNAPAVPAFYEWSLGGWTRAQPNHALGLALGAQWAGTALHIDASVGLALLQRKTRNTGTHQQFLARYGIGYRLGRVDIGLYQTHYSNFKQVFGWDGRNLGFDFLTLQVSYALE
jgi:hypothetical protein